MKVLSKIMHARPKLRSALFLGAYVALMAITAFIFSGYVDRESLQEFVERSGRLGLVVYALIEIVYVTFTPLLNTFVLIASGYIFGGHVGFAVNFFATSLGLLLIVFLVRRYGRPLLQKVISPRFYRRFDEITQRVGPMTLLIIYVLPFTPDDEITYIVAAGPVGFKRFILPVLLGTAAKAAFSYIGDLGAQGVKIAAYFRVAMLVVGLIAVGAQEYLVKKKESSKVV